MPIPLILLGGGLLLGGFGLKKGLDAKSDFDQAETLNLEAQQTYDTASKALETTRDAAQNALESLGKQKFDIYSQSLIPFVDAFSKIKNIDFQDEKLIADASIGVTQTDMLAVTDVSLKMQDVVNAGVGSLGAGGLAGLAAYGGIGLLGTASTGTAIGGLTGVAATNATLAWLGGGSLAAGGFGVAGGMAVLGGIVAGPVLAVGGMMMASKAQEAKEEAYANLGNAKAAAEQMKTAQVATEAIRLRVGQINSILTALDERFADLLYGLQRLVRTSTDYRSYSEEDKKGVMMSAMMAKTMKNIMEAPVIDERGAVTQASRQALFESEKFLRQLRGELPQAESAKQIYCGGAHTEFEEWYGSD